MISAKHIPPMKLLKYMKRKYPDFFPFADAAAEDARAETLYDHRLSRTAPSVVLRYLCAHCRVTPASLPAERLEEVPLLQALEEWRQCKNVYDFDESLTEELYRQAGREIRVSRSLLALPSYALYIRPHFGEGVEAEDFYVYWSQGETCDLYFLTVKAARPDVLLALSVGEADETLEDCLARSAKLQEARYAEAKNTAAAAAYGDIAGEAGAAYAEFRDIIAKWLTLVLYLTAVNADIRRAPEAPFRRSKKVSDLPREVELLKVGERAGVRLREMRRYQIGHASAPGEGRHRSPVMHMRRAHWHTYRVGSRKLAIEKRGTILKWIPPVIVNGTGSVMETVTINRVRK